MVNIMEAARYFIFLSYEKNKYSLTPVNNPPLVEAVA